MNVLLILGSERLYADMSRRFAQSPNSTITVLKLDKSGGCVDRDSSYMQALREAQVRAYFFGSPTRTQLSPVSQTVGWDEVVIYRAGERESHPSSNWPIPSSAAISLNPELSSTHRIHPSS